MSEISLLHRARFLKGFTLIELIVVITIIGLLAGIVAPKITRIISEGRDMRRKADIQYIATALEMFRRKYGRYPLNTEAGTEACEGWRSSITPDFMQILVNEGYLKSYPADPINKGDGCSGYCYSYFRYPAGYAGIPAPFYVLGARTLETGPDARRANVAGAKGEDWTQEFHYLIWSREDQ